jgi:hypothetical protein
MIVWHHHAGVTVWYPHHDDPYTVADILIAALCHMGAASWTWAP